jgi:hypothetical protein
VDSFGRAESVHYLMLPVASESNLNARAEARFKTLQVAVTLARIARERRHIRNNLPLKSVVVVAAKAEDVEALEYLKDYFLSEINAWDVTMSTEWEKLCSLKVLPNWKDLGKRLGKQMKDVANAVNNLTFAQISDFMKSGSIELCGFVLGQEDLSVKREFSGDSKRYEACVSDDGSLLIAIDTTCDDELYAELRSRTIVSSFQKLRKSAGLSAGDRVDIFYELTLPEGVKSEEREKKEKDLEADRKLVNEALRKYQEAVLKRLKIFPVAVESRSKFAIPVAKETINDPDICQSTITLYLTQPAVVVNIEEIVKLCPAGLNVEEAMALAEIAAMFVQTKEFDSLGDVEVVDVLADGTLFSLRKNTHFFLSASDRALVVA